MSTMSYISVIERYHDYRDTIQELLASIITGVADTRLLETTEERHKAVRAIRKHYPFIELLYTLDAHGIQTSDNLSSEGEKVIVDPAHGKDRSQRPYYLLARETAGVTITEPYLSNASGNLCVSAAAQIRDGETVVGYLILDTDLTEIIEYLMGDTLRRRFQPFFRAVYSLIVLGLMGVVGLLLHSAFSEVASLLHEEHTDYDVHLKPFGVIIFLTLALAIFDLGKTILEEEVLMHKDIFRHSSTRRTITRFIAAILIAVSIEALLMMFKAALGGGTELMAAVWMMLAAVGLLIGLGIYVFLGARAEEALLKARKSTH